MDKISNSIFKYIATFITGIMCGVSPLIRVWNTERNEITTPSYVYHGETNSTSWSFEEILNDSIYRNSDMPSSCNNPYFPVVTNNIGTIPDIGSAVGMTFMILTSFYSIEYATKELPYNISLVNDREWIIWSGGDNLKGGEHFVLILDKKTNELLYLRTQ